MSDSNQPCLWLYKSSTFLIDIIAVVSEPRKQSFYKQNPHECLSPGSGNNKTPLQLSSFNFSFLNKCSCREMHVCNTKRNLSVNIADIILIPRHGMHDSSKKFIHYLT